jgi:hypothetical protein
MIWFWSVLPMVNSVWSARSAGLRIGGPFSSKVNRCRRPSGQKAIGTTPASAAPSSMGWSTEASAATARSSASLSIRNGAISAWKLVTPTSFQVRTGMVASSTSPDSSRRAVIGSRSGSSAPALYTSSMVIEPPDRDLTSRTSVSQKGWAGAPSNSGVPSRRVMGGSAANAAGPVSSTAAIVAHASIRDRIMVLTSMVGVWREVR